MPKSVRMQLVIDPFARNAKWGTHTNDINPNTSAMYHLDVFDFLEKMIADGLMFDVALLDPPYSLRQAIKNYDGYGRNIQHNHDALRRYKNLLDNVMKRGSTVITFAWNSGGLGIVRNYELVEVMLLSHGGPRNDTIITVERKR